MKNFLIAMLALPLFACGPGTVPVVEEVYPDKPSTTKVSSSYNQVNTSMIVDYDFEDAYEGSSKAIMRIGLVTRKKDQSKGVIIASGNWQCSGRLSMATSAAIYVEQVSKKPETKISIVANNYFGECAHSSYVTKFSSELSAEILKVLSTF